MGLCGTKNGSSMASLEESFEGSIFKSVQFEFESKKEFK